MAKFIEMLLALAIVTPITSLAYLGRLNCNSHYLCRNGMYFRRIPRFPVPRIFVSWKANYSQYNPTYFNSLDNNYDVDPEISNTNFKPKWNSIDGDINRVSETGNYTVAENYPLNPIGRTGLKGRGVLPRWGPNHSIVLVVTRWQRSINVNYSVVLGHSKMPVLQYLAIKHQRRRKWHLPGRMLRKRESLYGSINQLFFTNVFNLTALGKRGYDLRTIQYNVRRFFQPSRCYVVYKGYMDDPRNTDNAWVEATAMHFHDGYGNQVARLHKRPPPYPGMKVRWLTAGKKYMNTLYGDQGEFVNKVVKRMGADW